MARGTQVQKYFEALERLKAAGKPINNDAVALEAGSGKGSIKASRPGYAGLIAAIQLAAAEQKQSLILSDPLPALRADIALLRARLDESLEREVNLLAEVYELREENRNLKKGQLTLATDKK